MFSSSAGPFQHQHASSSAQTPFQRLKPTCVELLSLTGRTTSPTQTQQVIACLRRLKTTLRTLLTNNASHENGTFASTSRLVLDTESQLPPSLIHYVFYPLSELISAAPKGVASLPDSVAELTLEVLALLCSEWWQAWAIKPSDKEWRVWCDLVILSSSVLGSPSSQSASSTIGASRVSDEVKLAALRVLSQLLSPRFTTRPAPREGRRSAETKQNQWEWEWDGVSDLPLLGDDEETGILQGEKALNEGKAGTSYDLLFPTPEHLSYASTDRVAKGAISFVLSSSFTIVESSQECTQVREATINVAHNALLLWIGWACPLPSTNHSEETTALEIIPLHHIELPSSTSVSSTNSTINDTTAIRLRPLLPGITSSLTRLATSRLRPSQDGTAQKPTPSSVAAAAIGFLADLLRATLSNECLHNAMAQYTPLARPHAQAHSGSEPVTKPTNLTDFADFIAVQSETSHLANTSGQISTSPLTNESSSEPSNKDGQWALSTLAQVHLVLKTFSTLTQPSLAGTTLSSSVHTLVQKALLRLAVILLSECQQSFAWLDDKLESMSTLDAIARHASADSSNASSVSTLLTWIVDLASNHNSSSVAKCARAAFQALQQKQETPVSHTTLRIQLQDGSALWSILTQALNSLPGAITTSNDSTCSRLALRISTILAFLSQHSKLQSPGLANLAKLSLDLETRTVTLLRPLKVEQLSYICEAVQSPGSSATWRLQPIFSGLEASTATQLTRMFFDFGRSLALLLMHQLRIDPNRQRATQVFSIVIFLIERAAQLRSVRVGEDTARQSECVTSLVMATEMLRGISGCLDNLELGVQFAGAAQAVRQARKAAHKLGKRVFAMVMDMLEGDAEEAIASRSALSKLCRKPSERDDNIESARDLSVTEEESSTHTLVERVKGISLAPDTIDSSTPARHGPVLDLAFVRAADLTKSSRRFPTSRDTQLVLHQAERILDLSNALLFALLSSASKLLGQSFRPLLLRGSYPLISGMSAASDLVRDVSAAAARDIAFNTAYADVKNCLLDHADYILGSACQRLISGLDEELHAIALSGSNITVPGDRTSARHREGLVTVLQPLVSAQRAPFVLVEMIRVLGSEIVPMVEDAIDEILDALDRFHQHPSICDGLLAVLDSILETMATEERSKPSTCTSRSFRLLSAGVNESQQDEKEEFAAWLATRRREQSAFDHPIETESNQDELSDAKEGQKEEEDKPSKSQQVASQILTKAISFLTHPSPILRSRVLGLLRHGIVTLAAQSRTAELLPIINTAWPYVMSRLGTAYSCSKSTHQLQPIIHLEPRSRSKREAEIAWRELEGRFVEKDPEVWMAAARFVESAVEWVPEFVGKRVVEEAWPRFDMLLQMVRFHFDPRMQHTRRSTPQRRSAAASLTVGSESQALLETFSPPTTGLIGDLSPHPPQEGRIKYRSASPHIHIEAPFILASATSLPGQLTIRIVTILTTVIRHLSARMPDDAAWSITSHPHLLGLLDSRQPTNVLRATEALYTELGRRNPEATAWAIQAAFPKASTDAGAWNARVATPCFMHHARAVVHPETVHCIVSGFNRW